MLAQSKGQYKAHRLQSKVVPCSIGCLLYVLFQNWMGNSTSIFCFWFFHCRWNEVLKNGSVVKYILWFQTSTPAAVYRTAVGTHIQRDRNHIRGAKTSSTRFPYFIKGWTLPGMYYYCNFESGMLLVALKSPTKPSHNLRKRKVFFRNSGYMSPTSPQLTQPTSLNITCSQFPLA